MVIIVGSMLVFGFVSDNSNQSRGDGSCTAAVPDNVGNLEKFIAGHEGFASMAYRGVDAQNLTIGYGHVIAPGDGLSEASVITEEQAVKLMEQDISGFVPYVDKTFAGYKLTTPQRDAILDFAFGEGTAPFTKNWTIISDLKGYLNGTVTADALKNSFLQYTKAGGKNGVLTNRRLDDWKLFCYGDYGFKTSSL